jgi:predicted Zn-dependent peptidase
VIKKHKYWIEEIAGVKTVLFPLRDKRTFFAELIFNAGCWYENKQTPGVMHFLEHMLFNGTKMFPNKIDFEEYKEEHGLYSNAYTSQKYISAIIDGPDYSIEQGITSIAQITQNPLLPQSEIDRELGVVTQEYLQKYDKPFARFTRAYRDFYYKDHLYQRDPIGLPETLKGITHDDFSQLHSEFFNADNAMLFILGNFKYSDIKKIVRRHIKLESGKNYKGTLKFDELKMTKDFVYEDAVDTNQFFYDWETKGEKDLTFREKQVMNLGRYILGGSFRSLLMRELRHKMGIVYSASAYNSYFPTFSHFGLSTTVSVDNTSKAREGVDRVLETIVKEGIDKEIFRRSKGFIKAQMEISMDSAKDIADMVIGDLLIYDKIISPEERIQSFESISKEEIEDFYKKLFTKKPLFSMMSPKPKA